MATSQNKFQGKVTFGPDIGFADLEKVVVSSVIRTRKMSHQASITNKCLPMRKKSPQKRESRHQAGKSRHWAGKKLWKVLAWNLFQKAHRKPTKNTNFNQKFNPGSNVLHNAMSSRNQQANKE